jgi:hypothetical protein
MRLTSLVNCENPKLASQAKHTRSRQGKARRTQKQTNALNQKRDHIIDQLECMRSKCKRTNTHEIELLVKELKLVNKQRKKLQAHGLMPELPSLPELPEYSQMVDSIQLFVDVLESSISNISEGTVKVVSQIVTTLFNVIQNPSWSSIIINLTNLLVQYLPREAVDYIVDAFKGLFTRIVPQGLNDLTFAQVMETLDLACNLAIYKDIEEFFLKAQAIALSTISLSRWESIDFETLHALSRIQEDVTRNQGYF